MVDSREVTEVSRITVDKEDMGNREVVILDSTDRSFLEGILVGIYKYV